MRKYICLLILVIITIKVWGQATDVNAVAVSPYVAPNCGIPPSAETVLESKLTNLILASGMISDPNQRFILTAQVTTLTEDVTATAPVQYVYTLSVNLYFGDGIDGKLFASSNFETKGVGVSKEKAYLAALKALSPNDPKLKAMLKDAQEKVVEYYDSQGPSILRQAEEATNKQNYDEAFYLLNQIPSTCPDLFAEANDMKIKVYNASVSEEGERLLAEARDIWNNGQNKEAADRAGAILASIDPQSSAYKEAQTLHSQIAAKMKSIDDSEWNVTLQQPKDDKSVRKAQLKTAKEIAVARAKNQPKAVYRSHWW